ncbi:SET2 [Candida theae]|uniref:Histone-lysine N-methyltransferase, H3 lysine-36 specific n=1 Tax=Candida theae TaxID=1198502 RepID=A0AAD5FXJ1_9ASCO|nr:SET2 [Candida theae]KAI5953750.1 SET2 [Candida theae]
MNGLKKNSEYTPPLFLDVEDKTEEALTKFQNLQISTYQSKSIAAPSNNKRPEYMTCDCEEEWDGEREMNLACGEDSNCINRLTSVECTNRHCLCGDDCQNQRFQKRQYADVSVFQTELKGYGLKANKPISEGQFIYEYIGEVIDEETFRQKMIEYDMKKYKHFYFMMLKPDAFIDATEKGSLARFVNHSCNPNAFVDKWVVGDKLRMGIFAKRRIAKGEEITFDYNVDRYGAQSQPCYCGEPNCIKFMGGKKQTDAALLLPEGIAEALGVTSRMEKAWLKENKHLRGEQQDDDSTINEMFVQSLEVEPMQESDVSKVMAALLKSQQESITTKLILRMHMTDDTAVNSLMVKLHGYKTMSGVLQGLGNEELIKMILEILSKWPAITKNKISSSQIEDVIKDIQTKTSNEEIKQLASDLLSQWSVLEIAYRIPKNQSSDQSLIASYGRKSRSPERGSANGPSPVQANGVQHSINAIQPHSATLPKTPASDPNYGLPENWQAQFDPSTQNYYYYNVHTRETTWDKPGVSIPTRPKLPTGPSSMVNQQLSTPYPGQYRHNDQPQRNKIEEEIARREEEKERREREARAREQLDTERKLKELIEQAQSVKPTPEPEKKSKHRHKHEHKHKQKHGHRKLEQRDDDGKNSKIGDVEARVEPKESSGHQHHKHRSKEGKESSKEISIEARWKHVMAKHVPNLLKSYVAEIGKDNVKGCAKEIVNKLASREANKGVAPSSSKDLDKHKLKKMKEYSDTYMEKFLAKYRSKHHGKRKLDENNSGGEAASVTSREGGKGVDAGEQSVTDGDESKRIKLDQAGNV